MTYAGYAAPGDCVTKISGFERLSTEALYLSGDGARS